MDVTLQFRSCRHGSAFVYVFCMSSHLELAKNVPHGDQQTERIVLHPVEYSGMRWCGRVLGDNDRRNNQIERLPGMRIRQHINASPHKFLGGNILFDISGTRGRIWEFTLYPNSHALISAKILSRFRTTLQAIKIEAVANRAGTCWECWETHVVHDAMNLPQGDHAAYQIRSASWSPRSGEEVTNFQKRRNKKIVC